MVTLKEGEIPTVGPDQRYNEYIPIEMGFKEHWPIGYLRIKDDDYRSIS